MIIATDGDLHGGSALSSLIRSRLRALARITALTCVGVFASTGVALASSIQQSASTPAAQSGETSGYVSLTGDFSDGTADQLGTITSSLTVSGDGSTYATDSGYVGPALPYPYRSG